MGLQPQYEFDTISHKKATWHNNQKHRWDGQAPAATVRGPVGGTSGYLVNNHQYPHQRPTGGRPDSPIALAWKHNVCWRIFGNTTLR